MIVKHKFPDFERKETEADRNETDADDVASTLSSKASVTRFATVIRLFLSFRIR